NRFLIVAVKRSKKLPFGGNLTIDRLLIAQLQDAVNHAKAERPIQMSQDARALWARIYSQISDADTGLLGSITSRAEAQMVRLALIYALIDCSAEITVQHLASAKALWD